MEYCVTVAIVQLHSPLLVCSMFSVLCTRRQREKGGNQTQRVNSRRRRTQLWTRDEQRRGGHSEALLIRLVSRRHRLGVNSRVEAINTGAHQGDIRDSSPFFLCQTHSLILKLTAAKLMLSSAAVVLFLLLSIRLCTDNRVRKRKRKQQPILWTPILFGGTLSLQLNCRPSSRVYNAKSRKRSMCLCCHHSHL